MPKQHKKTECGCDDGYVYYGSGCSMQCDCRHNSATPKKAKKKTALRRLLGRGLNRHERNFKILGIEKSGKETSVRYSYENHDFRGLEHLLLTRKATMKTKNLNKFRKALATGDKTEIDKHFFWTDTKTESSEMISDERTRSPHGNKR